LGLATRNGKAHHPAVHHRKRILCLLAGSYAGLAGFLDAAGATPDPPRPNLVFLLADDQCTYSMGCYGNPDVRTPNLDRLAREGMAFDNHYDTTAICMASRASILTGKFEYKTGCNFEHGPLLRSHWVRSYPVLLRQAGYRTAFAGKIGLEVAETPGGRSRLPKEDFDQWGAGPGQTSYETARNASMARYAKEYPHSTLSYGAFGRDFIKDAAEQGGPFCLSISFKAPHRPPTPDPRFDQVYANADFTKPANFGREHGEHFARQSRQGRQYVRFHEWGYSTDYDGVMRRYHQQVYGIDVAVGMIRQALEEAGVAENTVVIYTSDNGFLCGAHGYASKVLPYEESSRVPLIIYDPRRGNPGRGRRCRALTGNVDIAPTLLDLAGVSAPPELDGRSLAALYADPSGQGHEHLPLINVWGPSPVHSLSVVTRDWKYVFWSYGAGEFVPQEELYNTQTDPLELSNVIHDSDTDQVLSELHQIYDEAVAAWRRDAVPYHRYREFGVVFDRTLSWHEKMARLQESEQRERLEP
jgi:arylsulfatase A-like enzyme